MLFSRFCWCASEVPAYPRGGQSRPVIGPMSLMAFRVAFAMSVRVPNNTPEPKLYMDDLSRSTVVDSAATFYPVGKVLAALMIFLETMEG